ncbi:Agamous-like MADS-box protein AGL8-like protein, partial [Drosera capensis]
MLDSNMERILERYERYSYAEKQLAAPQPESHESWTLELVKLKARLEILERNHKHYRGEDLDTLSIKELQNLEHQLDVALKHIKSKKNQLMYESISQLQKKMLTEQYMRQDKALQEQNNQLAKKVKEKEKAIADQQQKLDHKQDNEFTSPYVLSIPLQAACIIGSTSKDDEGTQNHNHGTSTSVSSWMIHNMN